MNWKTAAIGSLLTVLISANNDANAAQSVRTLALGVLRIGTYFVNPPFEYLSEGKNVGFEVDLMNEIARRLGLQPFFVNTQWELILQQMQDGLYDCIDSGITITSARQQMLAWSTPYMTTTLSLVLDSKRTSQIRSPRRLEGSRCRSAAGDDRLRRGGHNAEAKTDQESTGFPSTASNRGSRAQASRARGCSQRHLGRYRAGWHLRLSRE